MKTSHPVFLSASIGGAVGLSVALTIAVVQPLRLAPEQVILALWPTAIFGFGYNGGGGLTGVPIATVVFGGNAVIYVVVASLLAGGVVRIRNIGRKDLKLPLSIKPRDE